MQHNQKNPPPVINIQILIQKCGGFGHGHSGSSAAFPILLLTIKNDPKVTLPKMEKKETEFRLMVME